MRQAHQILLGLAGGWTLVAAAACSDATVPSGPDGSLGGTGGTAGASTTPSSGGTAGGSGTTNTGDSGSSTAGTGGTAGSTAGTGGTAGSTAGTGGTAGGTAGGTGGSGGAGATDAGCPLDGGSREPLCYFNGQICFSAAALARYTTPSDAGGTVCQLPNPCPRSTEFTTSLICFEALLIDPPSTNLPTNGMCCYPYFREGGAP
jgi:hypothetical protein